MNPNVEGRLINIAPASKIFAISFVFLISAVLINFINRIMEIKIGN